MNEQIERAAQLVRGARRIVALTGAGFSVPSGIPDFRSDSGLWASDDPMVVASLDGFSRAPERFYRWIGPLLDIVLNAAPNPAHAALAELERQGVLRAVITQNIDGLHQRAGSREVFELHGNLRGATCIVCGRQVPSGPLISRVRRGEVPRCTCGGAYKPDVILFGEGLPMGLYWLAVEELRQCDLLIVAGTSLEVAPVCDMPDYALQSGAKLLIVNKSATGMDRRADVVIRGDVAEVLPDIVARAKGQVPEPGRARLGWEPVIQGKHDKREFTE